MGVNSAVRAAVVGDGPPRDNGRVMWRAVINGVNMPSTSSSNSPRPTRDLSDLLDGPQIDGDGTDSIPAAAAGGSQGRGGRNLLAKSQVGA